MKISLGVDIAFVLGAAIGAIATLYAAAQSGAAAYAVAFLTPGLPVAFPILDFFGVGFDTPHFQTIWVCSIAFINAVLYAVLWALMEKTIRPKESPIGRVIFVVPVLLMVGLWASWFTRTRAEAAAAMPTPPVAQPVEFTSPLMGRWEGLSHGEAGDVPVTVIVRPAPGGNLDGVMYTNRKLTGSFENAFFAADSLQFSVLGFTYHGYRDGDSLTIQMIAAQDPAPPLTLHFAGPDTARMAHWEDVEVAATPLP